MVAAGPAALARPPPGIAETLAARLGTQMIHFVPRDNVVVGAGVLFAKVARHETRPLSLARVGLWFLSLWLWPGLWLSARGRPAE